MGSCSIFIILMSRIASSIVEPYRCECFYNRREGMEIKIREIVSKDYTEVVILWSDVLGVRTVTDENFRVTMDQMGRAGNYKTFVALLENHVIGFISIVHALALAQYLEIRCDSTSSTTRRASCLRRSKWDMEGTPKTHYIQGFSEFLLLEFNTVREIIHSIDFLKQIKSGGMKI